MEVLQKKKKQKHVVKKLTLLVRSPPIRCRRSGTRSDLGRVFWTFGYFGIEL